MAKQHRCLPLLLGHRPSSELDEVVRATEVALGATRKAGELAAKQRSGTNPTYERQLIVVGVAVDVAVDVAVGCGSSGGVHEALWVSCAVGVAVAVVLDVQGRRSCSCSCS